MTSTSPGCNCVRPSRYSASRLIPSGKPPDEGLAYDPTMTDTDEANIPEESDADPKGNEQTEGASR